MAWEILVILLFTWAWPGRVGAEPLQLRPRTLITTGMFPLAPGNFAIPCVTDWNGDGCKDLLVGYQTASKIALYLNSGTDANPVFTGFSNLQAGGADVWFYSGGCGAPAPWVCDFDHDGKRDLVVGNGSDGTVWFFQNTNTDAAPLLAPGVPLKVGMNDLTVYARATPYLHDWDEDGLKDLLCGEGSGTVYFFKNTNSLQAPIYAPGVQLQAGGRTLNLGIRSVVRVFDWDGDGLKDLVGSSDTGVYWCRNSNSNAQPILQSPLAIQAPLIGSGLANIYSTGGRMRLDLADWNNDGIMDLLVGNSNSTISYYLGYHFAFTTTAVASWGGIGLGWNSAPYLKYNLLGGSSLTNIQEPVAVNIPSAGDTTSYTNWPADNMRFYRVQIAP